MASRVKAQLGNGGCQGATVKGERAKKLKARSCAWAAYGEAEKERMRNAEEEHDDE